MQPRHDRTNLVVALTAFESAHLSRRQLVDTILLGQFRVNFGVILVALHFDIGLSVAIHAPPHGQRRELLHEFIFLNRSVTGLTLDSGNGNVLRVVEVSKIRQVVDAHPFNRLRFACVFLSCFVPPYGIIEFLDLSIVKCFGVLGRSGRIGHFRNVFVAVHTHVERRDTRVLAHTRRRVTVFTIDTVASGMDSVRIMNRLHRLVILIDTHLHRPSVEEVSGCEQEED